MPETINPTTEETISVYHFLGHDEVAKLISQTHQAQRAWKNTSFETRAEKIKKAAAVLRKNKANYARLMTEEMGKPLADGESEAEKCAWVCDYYAENAHVFLESELIASDASKSRVVFQPLGVVFAVMPWNFPFWQVFRFAVPALMAGNGALLKHAPNVFGCAEAIANVFAEAGFPNGLFQNLIIDTDMAAAVIENDHVKAVTLTGSTRAGRAIAEKAGACLKKTVLELGGSDPYIILEDAHLEEAASMCAASRLINNGQSCISGKRFIVLKQIREPFIKMFVAAMEAAKYGHPQEQETKLGPMARADLRDTLHRQVLKSIEMGAECLTGGYIPEGKGFFYPPTVLTNVTKGMPVYGEEVFGPVAAVIDVENEEEAIAVANDSEFGLGAAVFTNNLARAEKIANEKLEAGNCFVNTFVKSDPRLPFGGIKESGYGRELSHFGIREFVNVKTVYIA